MNAKYICFLIMPQPVAQLTAHNRSENLQQLVANISWALRDIRKPIGVSEYELSRAMPNDLKSSLPTVEEIEEELSREMRQHPAGGDGE